MNMKLRHYLLLFLPIHALTGKITMPLCKVVVHSGNVTVRVLWKCVQGKSEISCVDLFQHIAFEPMIKAVITLSLSWLSKFLLTNVDIFFSETQTWNKWSVSGCPHLVGAFLLWLLVTQLGISWSIIHWKGISQAELRGQGVCRALWIFFNHRVKWAVR